MNRAKTLVGNWLFFILLISTLLSFTRFALISFLVFLLIIGLITGGKKNWPSRTVWIYVFFFCFVSLFSAFLSIANLKLHFIELLLVLMVTGWLLYIWRPKLDKKDSTKHWMGLAAGLIVAIYVCLPIIFHPSSATVLRYSAKTGDDISHVTRIEAIRSFGGLLYNHQKDTSRLIDPGTAVSPQGWHVNGSFIEYLIVKFKGSDTFATRLFSYLVYKTIWLFITVFLVCSLFETVRFIFNTRTNRTSDILAISALSVIAVLLLVAVFGYGFQNYLASIGLVCACLSIGLYSINDSAKRRQIDIVALVILTITAFYTWTLAGGIAGLITLTVVLMGLSGRYKPSPLQKYSALAALILLSSLPIYELVKSGSQRGISTINIGGATPPIRILGVVGLILVTLFGIYKLQHKRYLQLPGLLILTCVGFLGLALYQEIKFHQIRYYDIKLAFLCSVILFTVILATIEKMAQIRNLEKFGPMLYFLLALMAVTLLLGLDVRKSAWPLKNSAPISDTTAKKILRLSSSPNNKNIVIYTPNREETFLANKLWSSIQLYNNKDRKALLEKLGQQVNE